MANILETNMPAYRWPLIARMDTFLRNSSIYLTAKHYLRKVFEWNLFGLHPPLGRLIMLFYFAISLFLVLFGIGGVLVSLLDFVFNYSVLIAVLAVPAIALYFFITCFPFLIFASVQRDWELGEFDERLDAKRFRKRVLIAGKKPLNYYEYIQTPEWNEKRKQKLRDTDYKCEVCNKFGVPLQVHHKHYNNIGNESMEDLLAVCKECHLKLELEKEQAKNN